MATDEKGPYTIIDGTHRAAALLRHDQQASNFPWTAILIDSSNMSGNRWHIGFRDTTQILNGLAGLVQNGDI